MNGKGFTLIELLVVIVIIGILAAVTVPRLMVSNRSNQAEQQRTAAQQFLVDSTATMVDAGVQLYQHIVEYDSLLLFDKWLEMRKQNHRYNFVLCTDITGYEMDLENVLVLRDCELCYRNSYANLLKLGNDLPTEYMHGVVPGVVDSTIEAAAAPYLVSLHQARVRWRQIKGDWDAAYRLCESNSSLPTIPRYEHSYQVAGRKPRMVWSGDFFYPRDYPQQNRVIAGWFQRRGLTPPTLE